MKKYIILFLFGILMFELTFFVALNFFEENNEDFVETEIEKIEYLSETKETSIEEEKVGINTDLLIEKKYQKCNHKVEFIQDVESEMINLTKEEFEEEYPEYELKEFSKDEIVVEEEVEGICDEHFRIVLGEDFIEVYKLDSNEDEELYLVTNISRDYLTDEDIYKLDSGIYVYGRQNINLKLEDYE